MSVEAPKRFDRIIAILIQLQSKQIVKAQELADRFEVSLRTIYRDIRTLEASGVPIVSEAGVGYSIMDGYRLPPVMFTKEEAGSFVAAEKLMQKFTDKTLGSYYQSAMFKVKSVLRGLEKEYVSALESQVLINPVNDLFNANVPNALEVIFESIGAKKCIELIYETFHNEEVNRRRVECVGLFHENNYWYLMAYCHLRQDYRQFRTDRIKEIRHLEQLFSRDHGTIDEYLQKSRSVEKTRVRILVDREMVRYIDHERRFNGFESEIDHGDQVEMTFMTTDLQNGFPRWYIMFGQYATILEPESLKLRVKEILEKTLERI